MERAVFIAGLLLVAISLYYYLSREHYEPLAVETPAGGIIDHDEDDFRITTSANGIDTDPIDTGIDDTMWGPLYPLPERPPYASLSGLPYNFPPLQNDIGDGLTLNKGETVFSNR
jgi:hypothetical protein